MRRCCLLFLFMLLPLALRAAVAENNPNAAPSALGFEFGIKKDEAQKIIKKRGLKVVEDSVDSKKVRMVIFEGALVNFPLDVSELYLKTRLEFWNEELMSSSLLLSGGDEQVHEKLRDEFKGLLIRQYGEPAFEESFMRIRSWTWQLPKLKLVLNSSPAKKSTKIIFTYKPLDTLKAMTEYDKLVSTPPPDPVHKFFLQGSTPAGQSAPAGQ